MNGDGAPKKTMGVDPYERNWMYISIGVIVAFFVLISIAGLALGIQVPTEERRVDPRTFADSAPWGEPAREVGDGEYEVYVVARTFYFEPASIEIPVDSTVTIYVSSPDVQHGFRIQDTNVNMQIVPGEVSKLKYTFDRPGEYPYICTEYCGLAHAAMFGAVKVVEEGAEAEEAEEAREGEGAEEGEEGEDE